MIRIPITGHTRFNFAESLLFLNRSDRERLHSVRGRAVYKLFAPGGNPVLVCIREDAGKPALLAEVAYGETDADGEEHIRNFITKWLHLDGDMRPFYDFASKDGLLMKFAQHPQALPLEDAGLHNALKTRLDLPAKPTLAEVKTITQHWQQHAAYATFYCWRALTAG